MRPLTLPYTERNIELIDKNWDSVRAETMLIALSREKHPSRTLRFHNSNMIQVKGNWIFVHTDTFHKYLAQFNKQFSIITRLI